MTPTSRGIAKRPDAAELAKQPTRKYGPLDTLRKQFDKARTAIAEVVPTHVNPDRVLRLAIAACARDPKLLECTPASILISTIQSASLGLEPNTALQQSYLVPFKNNKKTSEGWTKVAEAQLIIGYRGYILLATQSDMSAIDADHVHQKDIFKHAKGLHPILEHVPSEEADPGSLRGSYAVWELKSGSRGFRFWPLQKLNAHRDKYARRDYETNQITGTWLDYFEPMCLKTVIRDSSRFWPMSSEKIRTAISIDNREQSGPDFTLIHDADDRRTSNMLDALGEGDHDPSATQSASAPQATNSGAQSSQTDPSTGGASAGPTKGTT